MSVADDVKEAFQGTRGKVLIGGGVVVVLYIWWTRSRTPSTPAADTTTPAPDNLHTSATEPSGTSGGAGTGNPTTNAEWQDRAVKILGNPPYNYSETAVWNAISKAFLGAPITPDEENWIRTAMRALGSPPEGMPPLNITAPTGNPQGGGSGALGKADVHVSISGTEAIATWDPVPDADWYTTFWRTPHGSTGGTTVQATGARANLIDLNVSPNEWVEALVIAHKSDGTRGPDSVSNRVTR